MNIKDRIKKKVFKQIGMGQQNEAPNDRLTFINDNDEITRMHLEEYNVWYVGDSDELLNYYTGQQMWEYAFEPVYTRNKRNYFWAINSTENDIKRTHSGQPRNIVDTLVNITPFPLINAGALGDDKNVVNVNLQKILKNCNLKEIYRSEQLPLTLVEGWGCFKIVWDTDVSPYPIPVYYRAANVEFIHKLGKLVGVIFKDYYVAKDGKKYLKLETRSFETEIIRNELGEEVSREKNLVIENELFRYNDDKADYVNPVDLAEIEETKDIQKKIVIGPIDCLFAVPTCIFRNTSNAGGFGRSIFTGKIDLFDDLDQCLSQAANAVRRSTVIEYFNTDFLERDPNTGMPKQPKAYDRKYTLYAGQKDANGSSTSAEPVQVTQPKLDFAQYSDHAIQILLHIIEGIMSPATLGMDIAKKDNAEAQREKEKVTIFNRNCIISAEEPMLNDLCRQLLIAYEFMQKNEITTEDYKISIKFSEFADDSFENKLEKLGKAYDQEIVSDEMFMRKLYGDTLSTADFDKELEWLKEHHTKPRDEGMKGLAGGGANTQGFLNLGDEDESEL